MNSYETGSRFLCLSVRRGHVVGRERRNYGSRGAKPLHQSSFAGMLPRTMSQGTDAPKDADSVAQDAAVSHEEESGSPLANADVAASDGNSGEGAAPLAEAEDKASERKPPASESSEQASKTSSSSSSEKAVQRPQFPETEDALNIPKRQTVGMLAFMSALTLVAWFSARLACNAHPDQVREPKHFSTKDLAADPKNAAFEFHHSFETGDYETALDLATSDVKKLVEGKIVACERDPDACEDNKQALAGSVMSVGRVLDSSGNRSTVELVSHYRKSLASKTFQFVVEKQGDYYRVASRKEVPTSQHAMPQQPQPSPASSATDPSTTAAVVEENPVQN